jgi:hypothetical protein
MEEVDHVRKTRPMARCTCRACRLRCARQRQSPPARRRGAAVHAAAFDLSLAQGGDGKRTDLRLAS